MGRAPCCSKVVKVGLHKGPWTAREDALLTKYIEAHGEGQWRSLPKRAGLLRCGKSCRLRWMNYLRPDIKRGNIGPDEEDLIIRLHKLLGNRWSLIAGRLPGRTDNEIKNYWNTHLRKRVKSPSDSQKKKNKKNKHQKKGANCKENGESSETKVHIPKSIRLGSFPRDSGVMKTRNSSDHEKFGSGSLGHGGEVDEKEGFGVPIPLPDLKHSGLLHEEIDHAQGYPLESQGPTKDGMMEKLYGEYLDLLKEDEEKVQLDSFAESLWA